MIDATPPSDWRDLQEKAAQILADCGMDAGTDRKVRLARGSVRVDVWARDKTTTPALTMICECKHWSRPVSRSAVHAFRTVVSESGANHGYLISSGGFQRGALEAAEFSNAELVTWGQFQTLFLERWFRAFMAPVLLAEGDPLVEYTEPINSRIARRVDSLARDPRRRYAELRQQHAHVCLQLLVLWQMGVLRESFIPSVPLREHAGPLGELELPDAMLDAAGLRQLMEAVADYYRHAIAEFDEVFGGRV
jgi:restriction system protein